MNNHSTLFTLAFVVFLIMVYYRTCPKTKSNELLSVSQMPFEC